MKLPKRLRVVVNYVKYSGGSITVALNPLHWVSVPKIRTRHYADEFYGDNFRSIFISWLFFQIFLFLDDGQW